MAAPMGVTVFHNARSNASTAKIDGGPQIRAHLRLSLFSTRLSGPTTSLEEHTADFEARHRLRSTSSPYAVVSYRRRERLGRR